MYKDIAPAADIFVIKYPETIIPTPTESDYAIGFIRRYFLKKATDDNGHIFEVKDSIYTEYIKNPFWIGGTIKWRIAGPVDEIYDLNGNLKDKGVPASNKGGIVLASQNLKNIGLYLPNLLQFYRKQFGKSEYFSYIEFV